MSGQGAPQGFHSHHPVMAGVEGAPPTGAVGTIEVPVWERGAIADGAQRGNGYPDLGPRRFVAAEGARAAGGQVVLDEAQGRAGGVGSSAAVAGAVTADTMDGAVHVDQVEGAVHSDQGRGNGKSERFAEDTAEVGEDIGDHVVASVQHVEHQAVWSPARAFGLPGSLQVHTLAAS
jgi:hypothetical protein